jgi:DNA-binding MarR family transcriptional regulator
MVSEHLNSFLCNMNVLARRISSQNNLSLSQYYTLTGIPSSGISMSELSLILGIDNSTLTRNINILIHRSLLQKKQSSEDKREQIVLLSSKGVRIVEKLDVDMDKLLTQFISDIDEDQRQLFIDTLERLNWKMNCYINDL